MSTRQRLRDVVADYFRARPNRWIPHRRLMAIGGECAWRTRVSDCHRQLGMAIPNKVVYVRRWQRNRPGKPTLVVVRKISFRKFVPDGPVAEPGLDLSIETTGQIRFC